ncbi:MAG: hypothetical protein JSR82_02640 [Verrucomicrobia bacterium]|nr:hypothetical protein [Verrucomicrobiota bacterium]
MRQRLALAALVCLLALGWTQISLALSGRHPAVEFAYGEPGQNLYLVDRLHAGAVLYRDVFTQYGPLPTLALAWTARWCGNTAAHYLVWMQLLSVAGCVLAFWLLSRTFPPRAAAAWTIGVVFPFFLMPGSLADSGSSLYPGWERLGLLAIALAWRPANERSLGRCAGLGLLLGGLQLIKFGTAAVAGMALLIAEIVLAWRGGPRLPLRQALFQAAALSVGGLAVEGAWATWLYAQLPAAAAWDVLWPAYLVQSYRAVASPKNSIWAWYDAGYFVASQLPVLAQLALCLVTLTRRCRAAEGPLCWLGLLTPLAVATGFLPHRWTILPWLWLLGLGAAPAFFRLPRFTRWLVALALFPALAISLRERFGLLTGHRPPAALASLNCPNGEILRGPPDVVDRLQRTQEVVARLDPRPQPAVTVFPLRSGWEHFFGWQPATQRHTWFLTAFVPPRDEQEVLTALRASRVVVLAAYVEPLPDAVSRDPGTWGLVGNPRFTAETTRQLLDLLEEPIRVDAWTVVFPVRAGR